MRRRDQRALDEIFRACRTVLGENLWKRIIALHGSADAADRICETLKSAHRAFAVPPFLPDLARLEKAIEDVTSVDVIIPENPAQVTLNPTVTLVDLSWKHLLPFVEPAHGEERPAPEPGEEIFLLWKDPATGQLRIGPAGQDDLLALKIVVEDLNPCTLAKDEGLPVSSIDALLNRASHKGILIKPGSQIRRDQTFPSGAHIDAQYFSSQTFTLQWHVTQACDLHCRHCYDRSDRSALQIEAAYRVIADLHDFCRLKGVSGHISFSGGNPLLHPHFTELYRVASAHGFGLAILGNPAPREKVEEIIAIEMPSFFQVSLEGLEEHNDAMRGQGHFRRTLGFLGDLRDLGVYSMVMLTLTAGNIDQVIPLAERLRGLTDLFTFNRLSTVGEGAGLSLPPRDVYMRFLEKYLETAESNPVIGLKDNLINILLHKRGVPLFGGCAGYGCSAAFNFLALLPDGEVHACRKFPSPIGNVHRQRLAEIYDSEEAARYRAGPAACAGCAIRPVCGGCLASTYSQGLDVFRERDPLCFMT
jgi:selenobiotic family peptide radical SAM maturase